MMSGRKMDIVWNYFEKKTTSGKTGCRAKCKQCGKELQGIVSRMKLHLENCKCKLKEVEILDISEETECQDHQQIKEPFGKKQEVFPKPSAQVCSFSASSACSNQGTSKRLFTQSQTIQGIDKFLTKTSVTEKKQLDRQVARYVYATNASFNSVENIEFKKMIELLRPGYCPPSAKEIGGPLLDDVYSTKHDNYKCCLQNKVVCLAIDGWSNVHNEPVICVTASIPSERSVYLVNTVNTSGNKHTADYLRQLACKSIKSTEDLYNCKVRSFVTDNASNMTKMRADLLKDNDFNIVAYGCSAHILNLLAHDVEVKGIKEHVVEIMKAFRNTHLLLAWYREAGGKALTLPLDVRWNSLADTLEAYIENWPIFVKVCEEHRNEISQEITNKVNNIAIKRNAEDYLERLKPISVALDRTQTSGSTISDAVETWKVLKQDLQDIGQSKAVLKKVQDREDMALGPVHFLANILDPRYRGRRLTNIEIDSAMTYCKDNCSQFLPVIINYRTTSSPFSQYMFNKDVLEKVEPLSWWLCFGENLETEILDFIKQLFSCCAASAGVERVFSTFGFVHSKIRNRLGIEKASKLVMVFKTLNNLQDQNKPYKAVLTRKEAQAVK